MDNYKLVCLLVSQALLEFFFFFSSWIPILVVRQSRTFTALLAKHSNPTDFCDLWFAALCLAVNPPANRAALLQHRALSGPPAQINWNICNYERNNDGAVHDESHILKKQCSRRTLLILILQLMTDRCAIWGVSMLNWPSAASGVSVKHLNKQP